MKVQFQKTNPHRHKLFNFDYSKAAKGSIETIEDLRYHLQTAIELEHSTIPVYLCALYSIKEGTNVEASAIIKSVVVEEMLHMILAANILNAIGGTPSINSETFIPNYPTFLPHSDNKFKVHLRKFSKEAIKTFLKIEKPVPKPAPPEGNNYHSIGQFYEAICIGLAYLNATTEGGIFTGDPKRQVPSEQFYGSGGKLFAVTSLEAAWKAIEEIVGQGEGISGTIEDPDHTMFGEQIEYAHYFRFNEILHERLYCAADSPKAPPTGKKIKIDWDAVYDMQTDPKIADYKQEPELYNAVLKFNTTYMALLNNLHLACNGQPDLLMPGVGLMFDLKYKAIALMKTPVGNQTCTAGPSFEFVRHE